jgi:hypothetical protein
VNRGRVWVNWARTSLWRVSEALLKDCREMIGLRSACGLKRPIVRTLGLGGRGPLHWWRTSFWEGCLSYGVADRCRNGQAEIRLSSLHPRRIAEIVWIPSLGRDDVPQPPVTVTAYNVR